MSADITRREALALLGASAAWPLAARAQQTMRRVGVLSSVAKGDSDFDARNAAFQQRLHELGWIEGRTITIDYRYAAGDIGRMPELAAELIALSPDVLVAVNAGTLNALAQATKTIPIVFANVTDPVGLGIVKSLAHPGGNITGFANREASFAEKWLELLRDAAPHLARITVMYNPRNPASVELVRAIEKASPAAIRLSLLAVKDRAEIASGLEGFMSGGDGGLIVIPDGLFSVHRDFVTGLAAKHRLPAIYDTLSYVAAGGLMAYGQDVVDRQRQAAVYVDRILKGENPGDLPVQQPTRFELLINLRAAKALGLTVPPAVLARADEVIE